MIKTSAYKACVALSAITVVGISTQTFAQARDSRSTSLEEVIVTAQKRSESLQEAPISVAALGDAQLEAQGITNLADLGAGLIPSLRIQPFPNSPSTLTIGIRGASPSDIGQVTRESSVAVYIDDVYMSRAQGLAMEVADLERVEVLRGPQGTLFGRNATGGAVRLISKKPSGEFGFRQELSAGNYDYLKTATHIDLPKIAGIATKLDYLHSQTDGWVNNTASGENDFGDLKQDAVRFTADWDISDRLNINYAYDWSDIEASNNYYQVLYDPNNFVGVERPGVDESRIPVRPLDPTLTKQNGHALTLAWDINEALTLKSISAYRELDEKTRNNYAGALLSNGLIIRSDVEQSQFSQEFQLLGKTNRLKWLLGLYYYEEKAEEASTNFASLNNFGDPRLPGGFFTPFSPPVPALDDAPRFVESNSDSQAIFGQATWTPPILDDRMDVTFGLRYTEDKKDGFRLYDLVGGQQDFDLDTDSFDPSVTLSYQWAESFNTYLRWANAYKAAGVNIRSLFFRPYDKETVEAYEVGLKSEFWDRRARLNLAIFKTEYKDFQIDFADPVNPVFSETIAAANPTKVSGAELELSLVPVNGLTLNLSYTYLDGDQPAQPNPLNNNRLERFEMAQTPQHAGSLAADYKFAAFSFGTLSLHVDVIATANFAYVPKNFDFQDSYELVNGRITLSDIPLGRNKGSLRVALWGKNLNDEVYQTYTFPVGDPPLTIPAGYGTPRTYGVEAEYIF